MIVKTEEFILFFYKLCCLTAENVEWNCFNQCFVSVLSVKCAECLHYTEKKCTFSDKLFAKTYFVKIVNYHSSTFSCCCQQLINFFRFTDLWALSIFNFSSVSVFKLFSSDSVLSLFILNLSLILSSGWSE